MRPFVGIVFSFVIAGCASHAGHPSVPPPIDGGMTMVALPGGSGGIGFDDLRYSRTLGKVLAPAGRSGNLDEVDPANLAVTTLGSFSSQPNYDGGHDFGVTSVDEGMGRLFATDRTSQKLVVLDPATQQTIGSAPLAAGPDYVRFVAPGEVWVTEPDHEQIEVFTVIAGAIPAHSLLIAVAGGPESLVIDGTRHRAYTHLWSGKTIAIDTATHSILETWSNGCQGSRGIALDEPNGILFAGCAEGTAVALDVNKHGRQLGGVRQGSGVDIIDFSPRLRHLYFPGAGSATMAFIGVSQTGQLSVLGTVATTPGAHCVTSDDNGRAFVCDPMGGRLLRYPDPYPASR